VIGKTGSQAGIRELQGGQFEAESLFNRLCMGATKIAKPSYEGTMYEFENGGTVGLRMSDKWGPTIDVNIPGAAISRIHFK
jgi:hypothetical protein